MQGLTQRQQMVLDFIRQSITDRGYPPTLREIGARMGIRSTNGVNDHLRALERKGYLTREDMKSRALRPSTQRIAAAAAGRVDERRGGEQRSPHPRARRTSALAEDEDIVEIPILGRVAAGSPLLAEGARHRHRAHRSRSRPRRARGVRPARPRRLDDRRRHPERRLHLRAKAAHGERGDIVVALIGDEATVKYYYPEKDYVRFQPANKTMAPILVRAVDFKPTMLLGVVVGRLPKDLTSSVRDQSQR